MSGVIWLLIQWIDKSHYDHVGFRHQRMGGQVTFYALRGFERSSYLKLPP